MNILTQNVCGLNDSKLQTISNSISPRHDILVLTETHLKRNHTESVIKKLGFQNHTNRIFFDSSPDPQDYKGVLLLIAKRTPFIPHTILYSGTGNHIIIIGSFQNKPLIIAGFYGYSAGSDRESKAVLNSMLDKITDEANKFHNPTISILGDFNFILEPGDHSNPHYRRKPQTEALQTSLTSNSMTVMMIPLLTLSKEASPLPAWIAYISHAITSKTPSSNKVIFSPQTTLHSFSIGTGKRTPSTSIFLTTFSNPKNSLPNCTTQPENSSLPTAITPS